MLPKLASWARDLCRHSPVGLGHETWAFWPCQAGFMSLADCPDHAESLDSQGPHARDWRKSRTFPLAQCALGHREKFREPPTDEVDGLRICAQGLVVVHLVHGSLHVQIVGRTAHVEGGFKCQGTVAEHLGVSVS